MSNDQQDFEEFMKQRVAAATAYVSGDMDPLSKIIAHDHDATFFAPNGGYTVGADAVATRYEKDSHSFEGDPKNSFEILQMAASDGIAYWVGFQRALVHLKGVPDPVPFNLRITEIFRRENGDWKMVQRHADSLIEEQKRG